MKLLFLDFETQGADAETTNPTEVGAVLFTLSPELVAVRHKALSRLIWDKSYPPQTEEIVEITGITDEVLKEGGEPAPKVFAELNTLMEESDYVLAHNRAFDQTVYESTCKRLDLPLVTPKKGWICTIQDVPYQKKFKCKKLSHLAYDHGILVHPGTLHRAINDVELLARLILEKYNIKDIIAYRDMPWVNVFLNGVRPPWEDQGVTNVQAKKLGYSWETPWGTDLKFPKRWVKRLKEDQLQLEKMKTPPHFSLTRST